MDGYSPGPNQPTPSPSEILARMIRQWAWSVFGCDFRELQFNGVLLNGVTLEVDMPAAVLLCGAPPGSTLRPGRGWFVHSPDYRSVVWFGRSFSFTARQAAAVRVLWEARRDAAPEVGQHAVLAEIESNAGRLLDVFRAGGQVHPCWGAMIVAGETAGAFMISDREPDDAE